MKIQCPTCKHEHTFRFMVNDYSGFVCSNCHSYFKGENPSSWIFIKTFPRPSHMIWATLGESVNVNQINYRIITKIQRINKTGEYSNEYVAVTRKHKALYLSDGDGYACVLREAQRNNVKFDRKNQARLQGSTYNLAYSDRNQVIYAEGFVFEDLEQESITLTYIKSDNEDKLISREYIGSAEECYHGDYWDTNSYYELFQNYYTLVDRKLAAAKQLYIIGLIMVAVLGASFYLMNKAYMKAYEFTFDQKFASRGGTNQFVGESFVLTSDRPQQLLFKGISESDKAGILLSMKLVNEETNEVYQTKEIQHFFNDVNYASGIEADFCKIVPGKYHLVFETSVVTSNITNFTLSEDYKITFGGISYWPLIVIYVLLVGIVFIYRRLFFSVTYSFVLMKEKALSYFDILKVQKLWLAIVAIVALQFGIHYLIQNQKTCSTSTKISTLEDHTYTGSRAHYYRRTYDDYGSSHK